MSNDPTLLSIAEVSEHIKMGELSSVELVEASLAKINQYNDKLNAFITIPDNVIKAAKDADAELKAGKYRGPLHGIPIGIKDLIDTEGILTTYGSILYKNNIPNQDATVIARLKEAGAILLGKTNTHEFALGVTTNNEHYGSTKNPWDLDRVPGGSSGGSAAATAAHLCFASLGSDTGGSVRIPAAFCGLVGLKPTYGRISLKGVYPLATSLDHVGPLTRTVFDSAILLQAMAGFDEADPRSLMMPFPNYQDEIFDISMEGIQIAISADMNQIPLDTEIERSFRGTISKIEQLGCEVHEIKLKSPTISEQISSSILLAEAATHHSEQLTNYPNQYGSNVIDRFRAGQKVQADTYIRALRNKEVIIREIELLFQGTDFFLSPTTQILPPKIGQKTDIVNSTELDIVVGCTQFTRLGNLTGLPVIALPCGYNTNSLPLSVQFMAPRLGELNLLNFAYAYEQATPELRNRVPTL